MQSGRFTDVANGGLNLAGIELCSAVYSQYGLLVKVIPSDCGQRMRLDDWPRRGVFGHWTKLGLWGIPAFVKLNFLLFWGELWFCMALLC